MSDESRTPAQEVEASINAVEEAYEFLLAYAAQGISGEGRSELGSQLSDMLIAMRDAFAQLPGLARAAAPRDEEGAAQWARFGDLFASDCERAKTLVELVLSKSPISSQLVDNLNASMHVRTVLTDLFLLSELLK